MKRGFLSQKGSGGGRGVKDKSLNRNLMNTSSGIGVSMEFDDTINEDTPVGVASTVKEGVTPSVVDMMVEKEKICSLEDTTDPESFPTLTTPVTNTAVNAFANTAYGFFLGKKVAYPVVTNYVRNTWGKYGLVRSMFSSSTSLFSFQFSSMDGLDAMLENVWVKLHGVPVTAFSDDGLSAIATKLVMIELRPDVELKDNIVVAMPKITREGHYTCAGEKKTMKKPSQTSRGVSVGPKIGFKPHKEYRHVPKKSTVGSVFGTNGGNTNLVNNGATSSGSSFMHVDNSSSGITHIIEKIEKYEDLLTSGQAILVDKEGNPLKEVEFPGEDDSEDEVASVHNDMARSLAFERVQDLSHELQAICDNLDIRVQGRKKK
ncbi:hypothetical protein Tco_1050156 [Tanacetum coccineum]